jgi:diguanylate cyclase (GGDEF)-like protein/PAS domain S-box-containing protein
MAGGRRVPESLRQRVLDARLRGALWGSGDEAFEWQATTDCLVVVACDACGAVQESSQTLADARAAIHVDDRLGVILAWNAHAFGHADCYEAEYRVVDADGSVRHVADRGRAVQRDAHGMALRVAGTRRRVAAAQRPQRDLSLVARAFDTTGDGMCILDDRHVMLEVNPAFERMTATPRAALLGHTPEQALRDAVDHDAIGEVFRTADQKGSWQGEVRVGGAGGTTAWATVTALPAAGGSAHFVLVLEDISERRTAEERLRRLANFDGLTGLANRAHMQMRLTEAVGQARRSQKGIAVLFVDLDRFKQVNDTLGHAAGDQLLVGVAERIEACIRRTDIAARWGGDEFVVLLDPVRSSADAMRVAQKLVADISRPLPVGAGTVDVSCSIGIATYPEDGVSEHRLLDHADVAMYEAKSSGRNQARLYRPTMNVQAVDRLRLEQALRGALAAGELSLALQPRVQLPSRRVAGVDALLRWQSATLGVVGPATFVPIAEDRGLMPDIGRFALGELARIAHAHRQRPAVPPLTFSLNVSARQLQHDGFAAECVAMLREHGVPPDAVEFEVVESAVAHDFAQTLGTLRRLRDAGFGLTLDNFGRGETSLSHLKQLPLTAVKLDRACIADIGFEPRGEALIEGVLALGDRLGLITVAEGVETDAQLAFLESRGCRAAQGFLFFRPFAAGDLDAELAAFAQRTARGGAGAA